MHRLKGWSLACLAILAYVPNAADCPTRHFLPPICPGDMRIVDDSGKELQHDGKTVGHLQVCVGACVRVGGAAPSRNV